MNASARGRVSFLRAVAALLLCTLALPVRPASGAADPSSGPAPTPSQSLAFRTVAGAGGVPLNVVTAGDPTHPAILLIHGLGQSYLSFERQLQSSLASRYFLVSFDLRGHGKSAKPWDSSAYDNRTVWAEDVAHVVAELNLRRPLIVGWSYGTLVTLDYLRQAPSDAVAGVALVSALGGLVIAPPRPPAPGAEEFARNRTRQLAPALDENYAAARYAVSLLTGQPMPAEWTERAVAIAMMLPTTARSAMMKHPFDNHDLLPAIAALPVRIIVGGLDLGTPVADARALAAQLPRGTLSVYEQSGHSAFLEAPERFNRELDDFARAVFGDPSAKAP